MGQGSANTSTARPRCCTAGRFEHDCTAAFGPGAAPTAGRPAPPGRALRRLLPEGSAGGLALVGAAILALAWANSPGGDLYRRLLAMPAGVTAGSATLMLSAGAWVNEGLMAVFFLLVALEIRREMTTGHLATMRQLALPGLAALGGMVAPALIYLGFNHAGAAAGHGWAVPIATDIAFALAALNLLGKRVPIGLKVFLTALAIIDDLGAIIVIALFYTARVDVPALAAAAVVWAGLFGLGRAGVRSLPVYLIGGVVLWTCVLRSGLHPTLAGVALAFALPMTAGPDCPAHRLERALGVWVSALVLPLFGLANTGLRLDGMSAADLLHPVALGTALGLLIGKPVGVFAAAFAAVRLRLAHRPAGLTWRTLFGAALLCGIGFTMSLFIGDLTFHGTVLNDEVKAAVFLASLASAALGVGVLATVRRR